jgi:hypothetical protein
MRNIRRRPSPAMVVALIALFIALGGPAQARDVLNGKLLRKGSVSGRAIKDHSIAKADLSKAAVRSLTATPAKSVGSSQIIDGQVHTPDLGAGAVGANQLGTGAVTASKLAASSVGGGSVANGSLQTVDIGSFTGAVSAIFANSFDTGDNRCQVVDAPATPAGGSPDLSDDVIAISPPTDFSDYMTVNARPLPGNVIRIRACWVIPGGGATGNSTTPPRSGPYVFRYVTFDSP